jgi:hypothetical protein
LRRERGLSGVSSPQPVAARKRVKHGFILPR